MFDFFSLHKNPPTDGLRVAVLLSGELRTVNYCLPKLFKTFSGPHETHFFLSTWDQSTPADRTGSKNIFVENKYDFNTSPKSFIDNRRAEFCGTTVEPYGSVTAEHMRIANEISAKIPQEIKDKAYPYATSPHAIMITLNQWYLIKKGYELIQNFHKTQKIDIIVRARPDIILRKPMVWPNSKEIVSDCLRLSRRGKHYLFDGYFAGYHAEISPLLKGYDFFLKQLALQNFCPTYISNMKINWPFGQTSHQRRMGSQGRRSILESEHFYRYLLAQQTNCAIIDSRVNAEMVRSK